MVGEQIGHCAPVMANQVPHLNAAPSIGDPGEIRIGERRYRRRVRPGFHLLSERQVNPAFGRHDKIELTLVGAITSTDDQDVELLADTQHTVPSGWRNVLSAPRLGRSSFLHRVATGWLFSGRVRYWRTAQPRQWQVSLELSINPTRFAAHVRRFNPQAVQDLQGIPPHELLRIDPDQQSALEAAALTDWDNYLPGADRWITRVTEQWDELVTLYVNAIASLVVTDFTVRSQATFPLDMERPVLSLLPLTEQVPQLHHVEVYWEFPVDDARLSFSALERALRAAAPNFTATEEYTLREGRRASAKWISTDLRTGVALKVYPKLSTRLRIEVTYNGRERSVGDVLYSDLRFVDNMSFWQRLHQVRLDGARRSNRLLAGLPDLSMNDAADDMHNLASLLAEISKLTGGDRSLIRQILSQLTTDMAIDARPRTKLDRVAQALERAGALERVALVERSPTRRYILRDPVASMFSRFHDRLVTT